jgi:signal transduction histidine kinase
MGLMGFGELARGQVDPGSPADHYLAELLAVAEGARVITRELHAFSRSGRPQPGSTRLADTCRLDSLANGRPLPEGVRVGLNVPDELPPVAVGTEAMRLIVDQLFGNAADAMPGGGVINVTARLLSGSQGVADALPGPLEAASYVELTVADTGSGMTPDVAERAGRVPFLTTKVRHRGLGLSTVLRTLAAHGGGLRLESSPRGTAVIVYLPTADVYPAPPTTCRGVEPLEVAPP